VRKTPPHQGHIFFNAMASTLNISQLPGFQLGDVEKTN